MDLLVKIPARDYSRAKTKEPERQAHEMPGATGNHLTALLVNQLLPPGENWAVALTSWQHGADPRRGI